MLRAMTSPAPPPARKAPTGREVQAAIYGAGAYGRRTKVPVAPDALQARAAEVMTPRAWAYVAGSAGMERTAAANRAAFQRWEIVPRLLRDVSVRALSTTVLGQHLPAPLLLAPVGALEIAHRYADLAVARAARDSGLPMVISTQASHPMEDIARALGEAPRWYQLYWPADDALCESLVRRAEDIGSGALVLTLDTDYLGWRPRDLDLGWLPFAHGIGIAQYTSDPVFTELVRARAAQPRSPQPRPNAAALRTLGRRARSYPGSTWRNIRSPLARWAPDTFIGLFSRPSLTWADLDWLRARTSLPLVLKGVQSATDATMAVERGIDAIVVSNHGGRQVDGAVAALDALPAVVDAVGGRMPVLFDSGVRSGADAFIAIALGAAAVLVGRPWVYGLALAGEEGVREVLRNIVAELDLTMALSGCASVADISRDIVRPRPGVHADPT
jgi:lactate 2-monooxygenase